MAQVLAGLDPALHVGRGRGGRAAQQHAAVAGDVGERELSAAQPGAAAQGGVEGPQDGGALLGAALGQLEEGHVHPAVHQRGGGRVARVGRQQLEEEARHVGLALDGTHVAHAELHLQLGDCGEQSGCEWQVFHNDNVLLTMSLIMFKFYVLM